MAVIEVSTAPRGTLLTLGGEFGMLEMGELNKALHSLGQLPPQIIVVDLAQLTMLASSGMGALVALRRSVAKAGGAVRLAAANRLVHEAMRRAALTKLFEFYDSVEQAFQTPIATPANDPSPSNPA